jgi:hypothetical protein
MTCLAKEPANRPSSAREFLNLLDMFATNISGEIRTMEQRVPHIVHTPTPTSGTTPVLTREDVIPSGTPTPTDEVPHVSPPLTLEELEASGYDTPKKSRTGLYAGIVGVLAAITLIGFFMSQRGSKTPAVDANANGAPPLGSIITDTTPVVPPAPAATPESTAVAAAPLVDSQAIRDSLAKRRAARRDSIRKANAAAIAHADSVRRAQEAVAVTPVVRARRAAAAMFANAAAVEAFNKGATHKGGVLGSKRKGDLQTQIDALTPYLSQAGLTYQQFKGIVGGAGVNIYDEFGRIVPDALKRFSGGH